MLKRQEGFTLIELMIVVAIIAILASVVVPIYIIYIQKSRLTSLVFPSVHAIEINIGQQYATSGTAIRNLHLITDITLLTSDADTAYFVPTLLTDGSGGLRIEICGGASGQGCPDLKMAKLEGKIFYAIPTYADGKIGLWRLAGTLAQELGLQN